MQTEQEVATQFDTSRTLFLKYHHSLEKCFDRWVYGHLIDSQLNLSVFLFSSLKFKLTFLGKFITSDKNGFLCNKNKNH